MDATDLMILRKLTWKPYDPFDVRRGISSVWDIGRELEMHGSTVKRRLARMREQGVLHGMVMWPAPAITGVGVGLYEFTFASAREKKLGMAHLANRWATPERAGVTDTYTFVGNTGWVGLLAPGGQDVERLAMDLAEEAGATGVELLDPYTWRCDVDAVSRLDRRILHTLGDDALKPLGEVAEEVGVTARTVRNRLERMARAGAFVIAPVISPSRIQGVIPFYLVVSTEAGVRPKDVLKEFPEAMDACARPMRPFLLLAAADSREVDEAVLRAEAIPGVTRVELRLIEDNQSMPPGMVFSPVELLVPDAARGGPARVSGSVRAARGKAK